MRPRFGVDLALGLLLDTIIADGAGEIERFVDLTLIFKDARYRMGPASRIAVCLQFKPDWVRAFLKGSMEILNMVADFVSDDVCLGNVASIGIQLRLDLIEKGLIEINGLIDRAVMRTGLGRGGAAT